MEIHPAAELFPAMNTEEFERLKADIAANGQQVPVTYWGDQLLDGRHRLRACEQLGLKPRIERLEQSHVSDPFTWVISQNLHRRHLSETQRAMIAAKLEKHYAQNAKQRQKQHAGTAPGKPKSLEANLPQVLEPEDRAPQARDQAAQALNVSGRSVTDAKTVLEKGSKKLVEAVERGDVAVSKAAKVARTTPKSEQIAAVQAKPASSPKKPEQAEQPQPSKSRVRLPNDPTSAEVAEVELWLEHQDERPGVERFKTFWESLNEAARVTLRLNFEDGEWP